MLNYKEAKEKLDVTNKQILEDINQYWAPVKFAFKRFPYRESTALILSSLILVANTMWYQAIIAISCFKIHVLKK